jgi:hypothetical protein
MPSDGKSSHCLWKGELIKCDALELGLWCLTPLSTISWRSVLLVEKTKVPKKTTDLSQVTDKLDHIIINHKTSYSMLYMNCANPVSNGI